MKNSIMYNYLIKKSKDQDFMQKMNTMMILVGELYRVLISSFLILFVPQLCDDHICTLTENMQSENTTYTVGIIFNFMTMLICVGMYCSEFRRENAMINYLDVNKHLPSDNESVGNILEKLPEIKRNNILKYDIVYQRLSYITMMMFIINTILSGFVVFEFYAGSQTTSTFITNVLFMMTKLADVYSTVNTDKNIFYSAYLKEKVQYNDVDPDKKNISPHIETSEVDSISIHVEMIKDKNVEYNV